MKFIFPQNYNFKSKLFGTIDYNIIFINLIWDLFVFLIIFGISFIFSLYEGFILPKILLNFI